jgi:OOP family OmpA-OmpF porin
MVAVHCSAFNPKEQTMKRQHLIALAALAFSTAASAQNAYLAGSVGWSNLSVDCAGAPSCDKSDIGWKILGGYKFTPNVAGELVYFDFGKAKLSDPGASLDIGNTAWGAGIAFHQDLSPTWNFVARLGLADVTTKLSASVSGVGSASDSDSSTQFYLGLGVGYKISKTASIDFVWDWSKGEYDKNGINESGNANVFSVGMTFGF